MRRLVSLTMVCCVLAGGSGCNPVALAGRGLKEFRGASSKAQAIPGTIHGNLTRFNDVRVAPPRTDIGGFVESSFRAALVEELRDALTHGKEPVFSGDPPALSIEPEIAWYHRAGGLGGLLGKDSYAVGLFWLSAGGDSVGRVQVVTKSGAMRTGPEALARSMAKEFAAFLKKQRDANRAADPRR